MEKKTLYALGALIALSLLAFVAMRTPDKGERVGERPRPVAEIGKDTVATLEVAQPGAKDKVTITKKGDKWQVTAPYDKPADGAAVKLAVEALEKIKWGDITTTQKDRHAELEVTADKAMHVTAKDSAGKVLIDAWIGKAAGTSTMVRIEGKDDVWQARDLSSFAFKKEGKSWREHGIFDQKADEAEKVAIVGGGASVYLERLPPQKGADGKEAAGGIYDAKWKVVAPEPVGGKVDDKALKPDPAKVVDDGVVNGIVQTLSALRAGEFLDAAKPEEVGLQDGAPDQIEVRVSYKGAKTAAVRIGLLKGEDYHVQAVGSPQIFSVKKFSLERVAHLPQDVRDKTILQLKEGDLAEVTVQQGAEVLALKRGADGKWKADKVADADEEKAKQIADSFAALSGYGFVAPGSKELATLNQPIATVTLKPKTGAPVVLKVGAARGEDILIQKAGQEPMWLKKYNADRFLKKPADVAKDKK